MIEGINEKGYRGYTTPINQNIIQNTQQTPSETKTYPLQNLLEQIDVYTYTQEDTKQVEKELVTKLKKELDLKEEDIYELYKRGYNLENLYADYVGGYLAGEVGGAGQTDEVAAVTKSDAKKSTSSSMSYKVETIKKENDTMYLNALKSTEPITIQSLYQNNFKGQAKRTATSYSKEDVANVLKMNGMNTNEGNMWAADKLMSYGMGVSKEDIVKLQNIKAAVAALEPSEELDENKTLLDNNQMCYDPEDIGRITDDLGMVTDEHIEALIEEGKEVNINNLRESIYKNTEAILKEQDVMQKAAGAVKDTNEISDIKYQISQIRAKLTAEAAQRISEKMPIESSQLSDIVQELNMIREQEVTAALQYAGVEASAENIATVSGVMEVVETMKTYPMETVQIELETDQTASLKDIGAALSAYGENETPTELRFGETINKVKDQIEGVLNAQGIEVSDRTIQAAKALITNGMEVTPENVAAVLEIVTKVNTFLEDMTPLQAASLIKEGMNPYYASVDTILSWVTQEKVGQLKSSVAEMIVELEEKHEINEQQKKSLIGLYRIMNAVSQNKEEVIGYLFKNQLPLTVEKLQEATTYLGNKGYIEVAIDDDFGEIEMLQTNKQTAKALIESHADTSKKTADLIRMLQDMELPISESNISKLSKISALLYPYIKEQFKKELGKFEGMSTLPQSFLDKLDVVKNVPQEVVEGMLEKNIPLTLSNIYWMDRLTKEPSLYGQVLNETGLLKDELPDDLEEYENYLSAIGEEAEKEQEEATLTGDLLKYRNYRKIEEATQFQRQLIEKEGLYQIPFVIGGEQRIVNLYIHKDEGSTTFDSKHFKAVITYDTQRLGQVKAYVELKGENIGYRIKGENEGSTAELRKHEASLVRMLSGIGYNVQYTDYENEEVEADQMPKTVDKRGESQFEEIV